MAILFIPDEGRQIDDPALIKDFLLARGIGFDQWTADAVLSDESAQEDILAAYEHALAPYMAVNGYQTADIISVHPETPGLPEIRAKFLREHTHSEDEVRFFMEGQGHFWFHLDTPADEVFCVTCQAGDLLSVPSGYRHWFDLGEVARVKAIRIFTDAAGWVPHYTDSGIDSRYSLPVSEPI